MGVHPHNAKHYTDAVEANMYVLDHFLKLLLLTAAQHRGYGSPALCRLG
jgi:hypothetical protein